jgi:hypothetical protein
MRSISLTWTDEIDDDEAIVFVGTVQKAIQIAWEQLPREGTLVPPPELRPFGNWVLENADPEMDYASFQWYLDSAIDRETGSLRTDRFLELVLREPWQQRAPHYDLSLVHMPLQDGQGHFISGLAVRGRAAILSVHCLRSLQDNWLALIVLRRLTMHYVGQMLAVPIPDVRGTMDCQAVCVMRPADTLARLIAYSEQEINAGTSYCEQCRLEMGQRLVGSHFGNN